MAKNALGPDDLSRIVMLAYGTMDHGGPYWCYVAVKPGRYEEFARAMAGQSYNIQNFEKDGFGEPVVSGEGVMPPPDVTKKVAALFDVPVSRLFKDTAPEKTIAAKLKALDEGE